MAGKVIKGLTVEIGGDTTKLGKALENVEKKSRDLSGELGEINRLLKMDPGNTELLAQKQKVLADAVANTKSKLDTLRQAEQQVQAQFERGEVSEAQYRALQREIMATEKKLGSYENAARQTADALDETAQKEKEAAQEAQELGDKMGAAANAGLKALAGGLTAVVAALVGAAESTREYRTYMGMLETAFQEQGFSATAAKDAYTDMVGILGDADQATEATNHLAELVDTEKDLATWSGDILPGVWAKFGKSLPIEGLTEAANETAKVGQVTGPLADAINWATASTAQWNAALGEGTPAQQAFAAAIKDGASAEDAFNAALAETSTEQERQALITQTLNGLYGEASAAYKEQNADIIAANQANDAWMASLAGIGAAMEPVITDVKMLGAELLEKITPAITWVTENLPTVAAGLASITAGLVAMKIAQLASTAATQGMTVAQYAAAAAQRVLNAAMKANPIGLIITALGLLVTAFVHLWKNNEDFRKFWINLWKKIQEVAAKAGEAIKKAIGAVRDFITQFVAKVKSAFNSIKNFVTVTVPGFFTNMKDKAVSAVTTLYNNVVNWFKRLPSSIQTWLSNALSKVASWGTNMANKAREGMRSVITAVTNTLKELPGKIVSIGGDLVTGLWNGINDKISWLKNKISGFANSVLSSMRNLFGTHSPSRETAWIGDMLDQGLAEGMLDNMDTPIKAMERVSRGVLDAGTDGLALDRQLQAPARTAAASVNTGSSVGDKLDRILAAIERGQVLTIDGDALVGATANKFDSQLGQRRALAARGAV